MFDREKWGEVFESIGKNKLRAVLTGVSVFTGIFMLIMLLGMGRGLRNGFEHGYRNNAKNVINLRGGMTMRPWKGMPPNRRITLTNRDLEAIRRSVPGIQYSSGEYWLWRGNSVLNFKEKYGNYTIQGIEPDYWHVETQVMLAGRYINGPDQVEGRKVIVIADDARDKLFGKSDPLHEWIQVNGVPFEVVGVYKFESNQGQNQRSRVFIPLSTAQRVFGAYTDLDEIYLTLGDATVEESILIADRIRSLIAGRHNFDPGDLRAVWIENQLENYVKFAGIFGAINAFIWIMGIGTIIAGIMGVSNIMLIVVKERTREIGIRKAIGATPASVTGQVMMEALVITALAGYGGLLLGIGTLESIATLLPGGPMFRDPEVNVGIAVQALVLLIVTGTLAGLIPARHAARIRPIEALRDE
ncbi:MAG: ABC transporter permease [Flavobacteriales bacterium]|nr:ABC transporter permease [Flavobacteriales bacterium]